MERYSYLVRVTYTKTRKHVANIFEMVLLYVSWWVVDLLNSHYKIKGTPSDLIL